MLALDKDIMANKWNAVSTPTSTYGDGSLLQALQLRIYDETYIAQLDTIKKDDMTGNAFQDTDVVQLQATANVNNRSSNVVSALIYDSTGTNLMYYKQLEKAKGNGKYLLDLDGIPFGFYQVAILNEDVRDSDARPVNSSKISGKLPFSIIEYPDISYEKNPQMKDGYEYNVNVERDMSVGRVIRNNNVMPITYEIVSSNGTDTSFENFEISGLDASGASSATSLDVKIKTNAKDIVSSTNSLKAGNYSFCIVSTDANGDPVTPNDKTKVCTSFTVEKTQPSIAFTNDDKGTMYVRKDTMCLKRNI